MPYQIINYNISSFDGTTTKLEASSNLPHADVRALGNYKNSPFVTGDMTYKSTHGLKTEIMDYENGEWVQMKDEHDYPFANERYRDYKIIWN